MTYWFQLGGQGLAGATRARRQTLGLDGFGVRFTIEKSQVDRWVTTEIVSHRKLGNEKTRMGYWEVIEDFIYLSLQADASRTLARQR